jgi:hypothetical protein
LRTPACVKLVGHSYGGLVLNGAGHDADSLVYVCVMAPDEGQSVAEAIGSDLAAIPGIAFDDEEFTVSRTRLPAFYNRCDENTQQWAFARIRRAASVPARTGTSYEPLRCRSRLTTRRSARPRTSWLLLSRCAQSDFHETGDEISVITAPPGRNSDVRVTRSTSKD